MDWFLRLTAKSVDDSETLLRILSATIARNGGWVLTRSTSSDGVVHFSFEFEREACIDIYSVLLAEGLELSENSHRQLAQLCHCTKSREASHSFEPARVSLRILPGQLEVFEQKPEIGAGEHAFRFRS